MKIFLKVLLGLILAIFVSIAFSVLHIKKSIELSRNVHLDFDSIDETVTIKRGANGRFLIDIPIENKVFPFLIDNGARTVIDKSLLKKLKVKKGRKSLVASANGHLFLLDLVKIPSLRLGSILIEDMYGKVKDFSNQCGEYPYYGIIGQDILKDFAVQFDLDNNSMRLSNKTITFSDKSTIIPFYNYSSEKLQARVLFEIPELEESIPVMVDMGSNGFLDIISGELEKTSYPSVQIFGRNGSSLGKKGQENSRACYLVDSLSLDDQISFTNVEIFSGGLTISLLGCKFLEKFNFTIDYLNKQLVLEPIDVLKYQHIKKYGFGFDWNLEQQAVTIDYVYEGSSAHQAGLKTGQIIHEINGLTYQNKEDYCNHPRLSKLDIIDIMIETDEGEIIRKKLQKKLIAYKANTTSIYSQNKQ